MRLDRVNHRTVRSTGRSILAAAPLPRAGVRLQFVVWLTISGLMTGCAALTNPTINGVPVRILPDELLAESKEGFEPIPLTLLRQPPPDKYFLETGDTLGIYIEGILGSEEIPPPVNIPDSNEQPPSIGYPFPIREDGTVSLPYVGNVAVAKPALEESITIEEAEEKVAEAYSEKEILRVEDKRIIVSLMRPRYIRVLMIRENATNATNATQLATSQFGMGFGSAPIDQSTSVVGEILELPAYENDVLNAFARTSGVPDIKATKEIVIQRGFWEESSDPNAENYKFPTQADVQDGNTGRRVTRIPLRTRPGEPLSFGPKDVILNNGDIIVVRSQKQEFYYTGGLIANSEWPLPFDYDLNAVEAVLRCHGPMFNGGVNTSNLNGSVLGVGMGNPSPSLLTVVRKTPMGGQVTIRVDLNEAILDPRENILVQADDVLILQEKPDEAITRYATQVLQFNFFGRLINRNDSQGSASVMFP